MVRIIGLITSERSTLTQPNQSARKRKLPRKALCAARHLESNLKSRLLTDGHSARSAVRIADPMAARAALRFRQMWDLSLNHPRVATFSQQLRLKSSLRTLFAALEKSAHPHFFDKLSNYFRPNEKSWHKKGVDLSYIYMGGVMTVIASDPKTNTERKGLATSWGLESLAPRHK